MGRDTGNAVDAAYLKFLLGCGANLLQVEPRFAEALLIELPNRNRVVLAVLGAEGAIAQQGQQYRIDCILRPAIGRYA